MTTRGASCTRSARTSATATSITWWDCGPDGTGIPVAFRLPVATLSLGADEGLPRGPDDGCRRFFAGFGVAMRDDYRTRFAVLAECGYPGGVDPHVFLLDIDACVTVTTADAAVFDSLDQAVAAWREGKGDTARTARHEPVTDYSQLGFLVRCDASPNGPFRGDESRGYADNLFRANRFRPRPEGAP